jgi:hypothetical protein
MGSTVETNVAVIMVGGPTKGFSYFTLSMIYAVQEYLVFVALVIVCNIYASVAQFKR